MTLFFFGGGGGGVFVSRLKCFDVTFQEDPPPNPMNHHLGPLPFGVLVAWISQAFP